MATKYVCDGMRSIAKSDDVPNARAAAEIFANRMARREYGPRGYCRTLRADSWTTDGRCHHFEAFIGRDRRGAGSSIETVGHNEWVYVTCR